MILLRLVLSTLTITPTSTKLTIFQSPSIQTNQKYPFSQVQKPSKAHLTLTPIQLSYYQIFLFNYWFQLNQNIYTLTISVHQSYVSNNSDHNSRTSSRERSVKIRPEEQKQYYRLKNRIRTWKKLVKKIKRYRWKNKSST